MDKGKISKGGAASYGFSDAYLLMGKLGTFQEYEGGDGGWISDDIFATSNDSYDTGANDAGNAREQVV